MVAALLKVSRDSVQQSGWCHPTPTIPWQSGFERLRRLLDDRESVLLQKCQAPALPCARVGATLQPGTRDSAALPSPHTCGEDFEQEKARQLDEQEVSRS